MGNAQLPGFVSTKRALLLSPFGLTLAMMSFLVALLIVFFPNFFPAAFHGIDKVCPGRAYGLVCIEHLN